MPILLVLSLVAAFPHLALAETEPVTLLAADFNSDTQVDFDDFFLLVDQFGQTCTEDCAALSADLNSDKSVDFDDFFLFVDQFGQTFASLLVPLSDFVVPLGSSISFTLELSDKGLSDPNFAVMPQPLPDNATFDAASGAFSFTPAPEQAGQSFSLTFAATAGGRNDCQGVVLNVPEASSGTTALSGRVLDTNAFVEEGQQVPVVGATVSLLGTDASTQTDAEGHFSLSEFPPDSLILDIDASTATPGPGGTSYASFRERIAVLEGVANIVARPFYLPRLAEESRTTVDPSLNTVVQNPSLGVQLDVTRNSARDQSGELFRGDLTISEVPANLAPAALPANLQPALLLTIQPVGVTFDPPARISFPNTDQLPPGTEADIWSLDPASGQFTIVGTGRVSSNGNAIQTVEGGVRAADWHLTSQGLTVNTVVPDLLGTADLLLSLGLPPDTDDCTDRTLPYARGCADSGAGLLKFVQPLLQDPENELYLNLVYNSATIEPQPVVQANTTIPVRFAVPLLVSGRAHLAGVSSGTELYFDTSELSERIDESLRFGLPLDTSGLPSGLYNYQLTTTSHYAQSAVSSQVTGQVAINNQATSPFGSGWNLAGSEVLYPQKDNSVFITQGDGSTIQFGPPVQAFSGLTVQFYDLSGPARAVGNHFADFSPGTFTVTSAEGSLSTDSFVIPVINFPDIDRNLDNLSFFNVGEDGILEDASTAEAPAGDDFSIQPPGGNNSFGARFAGFLYLPDGGEVSFTIGNDDLFDLLVNGNSVLKALTGHDFTEFSVNVADLPAGYVPIEIFFGEMNAEANMVLMASGGGLPGGVVPSSHLFTEVPPATSSDVAYRPPLGETSRLDGLQDGGYVRTFADGSQSRFNAKGAKISVTQKGVTTDYIYDEQGRISQLVSPKGNTTFNYSGQLLSSVTGPQGQVVSLNHDPAGNFLGVTSDPQQPQYSYTGNALTTHTTAGGLITNYTYGDMGRLSRIEQPNGTWIEIDPCQTQGLPDLDGGLGSQSAPAAIVRPGPCSETFTSGGSGDGPQNMTLYTPTPGIQLEVEDLDQAHRVTLSGGLVNFSGDLSSITANDIPLGFTQVFNSDGFYFSGNIDLSSQGTPLVVTAINERGQGTELVTQFPFIESTGAPRSPQFGPINLAADNLAIQYPANVETALIQTWGFIEDSNLASITIDQFQASFISSGLTGEHFFSGQIQVPVSDETEVSVDVLAINNQGQGTSITYQIPFIPQQSSLEDEKNWSWFPGDGETIAVESLGQPHTFFVGGTLLDWLADLESITINETQLFFTQAANSDARHFSGSITVQADPSTNMVLKATNLSGQEFEQSYTLQFEQGETPNTAPAIGTTSPADGQMIELDPRYSPSQFMFSANISAPEADLHRITIDDIPIQFRKVDLSGGFQTFGAVRLPEDNLGGSHRFTLRATDRKGQSSSREINVFFE